MYKLLVNLFVKDNENVKNSKVRKSYGTLASVFGLVTNVLLVVIKLTIGLITSSISIIGDAINNITDSANSIISLFGFKMSSKPADKDHPYGHQRMEYISAFVVSIIVCVLGVELISSSFEKIFNPDDIPNSMNIVIIILAISVFIKIYQSYFYNRVGKKINSTTLKAISIDSRNDVIATSAVLIGLVVSYFTGFNLDGYLGVVVGILVLISGIKLTIENSSPLLGKAADKELTDNIISTINKYDSILGVHDLHIHSYGNDNIFVSCHVEMNSSLSLLEAHDLIDLVERECSKEHNLKLSINIDPVVIGDTLIDEIKKDINDILTILPFAYFMHDFRVIKGDKNKVVFDLAVPFDCKVKNNEIIKLIEKEVKDKYLLDITIDRGI